MFSFSVSIDLEFVNIELISICESSETFFLSSIFERYRISFAYSFPIEREDNNAHSDQPFLATIVEWPDKAFRFIFSQEAGANDPFFEFKDKSGLRFQFYEGAHGSGELYNRYGRLTKNSKVKIYTKKEITKYIKEKDYARENLPEKKR